MRTEEIVRINRERIFREMVSERWYPLKGHDPADMRVIETYPEEVSGNEPFTVKLRSEGTGMLINLLLNVRDGSEDETEDSIRSGKVVLMIRKLLESGKDTEIRFNGNRNEILQNLGSYHAFNGNQSNSSFIINGNVIGKFFRTSSDVENPDYIIPLNLWKHTNFRNTPEPLGMVTFREKECIMTFSRFMENEGDYWSYLNRIPEDDNFVNIVMESARNIASVTAKMHYSLSIIRNEGFETELFNLKDIQSLQDSYKSYEEMVYELCKIREGQSELFHEVYNGMPAVRKAGEAFEKLITDNFLKQRIHGDFHLGQILKTGSGPQVIDFEGEPMRSIREKSSKQSTMKDLAGLIRSFDYLCRGRMNKPGKTSKLLENTVISAYMNEMIDLDPGFREKKDLFPVVLKAFILEKAMYETIYESRNRPDWIHIPLGFIRSFINDETE
jgi:maltose alpha-D-glucosyltransferase/alpha-amylase